MDQEDIAIVANSDADGLLTAEAFYGGKPRELPFEQALMVAVLRQAIMDRALDWINLDVDFLFSFRNCCESVGIDYLAARKALNAKIRPGFTRQKRALAVHEELKSVIQDMPGRQYTHRYGNCQKSSRCAECRQRYNFYYLPLRRTAHTRERVMRRLAEAS